MADLVKPVTRFIEGLEGCQIAVGQSVVHLRSEQISGPEGLMIIADQTFCLPFLCTRGLMVVPQGWDYLVLSQSLCSSSIILK